MKNFFFRNVMTFQIAIPLIVIFVPIIAGMIFKALSIVNPQAFSNLLNFYFSLHGVLSTILMLYLQNPYREAVLSIFCCRKPVESKIFTTAGKFSRKSMTWNFFLIFDLFNCKNELCFFYLMHWFSLFIKIFENLYRCTVVRKLRKVFAVHAV